MSKLIRRIHYLLNRHKLERELEEEMEAHQEMMPRERRAAFGNPLRLREEARDHWGWQWLDDLRQDMVCAFRGFSRDRRFAFSAMAAITLAVGAATGVFSVVDRSLFRALPYRHGDRLVSVGIVEPMIHPQDWLFAATYQDWRARQTAFESITSWTGVMDCDRGDDTPEQLTCALVESTFLPTLGVEPILGRNFAAEEDRVGGEPVANLSFGMWRTRFGSDPSAVGKQITLSGTLTRIIGVLPEHFETPTLAPADVIIPQRLREGSQTQRLVRAIARLRPGNTAASSAAAMSGLFQSFFATIPADIRKASQMRLRVATLRDQQTREYQLAFWMLLGAVTAFVLIASANVANLLLARAAVRQQEFSIRAALGASRWRLVRQMLTECGLLAGLGGAGGCLLAYALLRVILALAPDGTLRLRQASMDGRVLGFALALSIGVALLFGLAPSLERLRARAWTGTRTTARHRLRRALIMAQLAASLTLLTAAGLLLTSLWHLQKAPLGFERERVLTATFTLPSHRYVSPEQQLNFFHQLEERLRSLPGTVASAITDSLPPGGDPRSVPMAALTKSGTGGTVKWRYVSAGYFEAIGVPIRRGRSFVDGDEQPGPSSMILSDSLARRLFGSEDPLGKQVSGAVVIGVAADVRNAGLGAETDLEFYRVRQNTSNEVFRNQRPPYGWRRGIAVVRSQLPEPIATEQLRAAIRDVDSSLPVELETMTNQVERFLTRPRFQTVLLTFFAVSGFLLAGIGLYGLVSFLVAERTREIGVRMALGATPARIARMVISDGLRWTMAGVVAGVICSALTLRGIQGLLFAVAPLDARVFAGAAGILVLVALVASWLPGRKAAQVAPVVALRQD